METTENSTPVPEKKPFKQRLKTAFTKWHIIAIIAGGIAGFFYYHFVGCANGACALKSNPYYYILLCGILGYLVVELFKKKKQN